MVPRRPPRPCCWTAPPGGGYRADPVLGGDADPLAGAPGAALASDPQTVGADPAGLAWSAMCCTVWHGSITEAHRCALIYLIIIGGLCGCCIAFVGIGQINGNATV